MGERSGNRRCLPEEEESVDHKFKVGDKVKAIYGDDTVGTIIRLTELSEDEPGYLVQFGASQDDFGEEELEVAKE
jgi:hypothetical protein